MNDKDLLELIDVIREVPREHWDLFHFVRGMSQSDVDRMKDLIQPTIPLPGEFAKAVSSTPSQTDKDNKPSLPLDNLRQFL